MTAATRNEHDLLGDREVPADAYWGIHTLRALENFPITGQAIGSYRDLVRALALVEARRGDHQPLAWRARRGAGGRDSRRLRGDRGRRPGRRIRRRRNPGRRRHLHQHERERGDREPRAGDPRAPEGRVPTTFIPTTTSTCRRARTTCIRPRYVLVCALRSHVCSTRWASCDWELRGEGDGVRRRAQDDGPHPAPGRGADDARPGIQHFRR